MFFINWSMSFCETFSTPRSRAILSSFSSSVSWFISSPSDFLKYPMFIDILNYLHDFIPPCILFNVRNIFLVRVRPDVNVVNCIEPVWENKNYFLQYLSRNWCPCWESLKPHQYRSHCGGYCVPSDQTREAQSRGLKTSEFLRTVSISQWQCLPIGKKEWNDCR